MSTHCKSAQLGSLDVYLVASLAAVIYINIIIIIKGKTLIKCETERNACGAYLHPFRSSTSQFPQVSLLVILASLPGTVIIGKLCLVLLPVAYGLLVTLVVRWVFTLQ